MCVCNQFLYFKCFYENRKCKYLKQKLACKTRQYEKYPVDEKKNRYTRFEFHYTVRRKPKLKLDN